VVKVNALAGEIEDYLITLTPDAQQVSSRRSGITAALSELRSLCDLFWVNLDGVEIARHERVRGKASTVTEGDHLATALWFTGNLSITAHCC